MLQEITDTTIFLKELETLLGSDAVLSDEQSRIYYANDVFWQPGILPLAIATPKNAEEVAAIVRLCASSNVAIVPRGAGLSYTKGSIPSRAGLLVVDMRKLNRIVEVNKEDLYVTVEAGCNWEQLRQALEDTGLRSGYWGPLSGFQSTIGGALSQTSAFFGSAHHGTDFSHVQGLTVVLANGTIVTTGSGGRINTKPFTREGGPDLTGLFLGDNGAFGIKLSATFKLIPAPTDIGFLSFGFDTIHDMVTAQVAIARTRLVSEGFGIDRVKAEMSGSVNKFVDGAKTLTDVARAGKTLLSGLKDAAAVAAAGTRFLKTHEFSLHLILEAHSKQQLDEAMDKVRSIASKIGTEMENTVPKVMRARPFGPPRGMLGSNGERWVPVNAIFPLSEAHRILDANDKFFAERDEFMKENGILMSIMVMTTANTFFSAPAFYWMDEITPLHTASLGEDLVHPWKNRPANEKSRNAMIKLRGDLQILYGELGGVGWQVGRDRPYLRDVQKPETWGLLETVKQALDPQRLLNPGALTLD